MDATTQHLYEVLSQISGYIYPNEIELNWSVLIVLYPYITGLVAGAFILASLERVFNVHAVKPTYRLALLTALAFLIIAPLPLQLHLGHPERGYEIFITPHTSSAMAMFGFVYLWYLMVVILLEIWFDYRKEIVTWATQKPGILGLFYKILSLGSYNISPRALELDDKIGRAITIIGIPSAVLLHGYVGFIFGSIKANPWWSTPLMPVVFLFSAMVSGIAMVMLIYMVLSWWQKKTIDMACLDTIGRYLLYAFIIDFALEMLDTIQRIYEAEESFDIISVLMTSHLFLSQIIIQILIGTLIPIIGLGLIQLFKLRPQIRKFIYFSSGILTLIGIFAMRWNVVIGGQLFSKSFLGFTVYKMGFAEREGLLPAIILLLLPLGILAILLYILPPWKKQPDG